MFESKKKRTRWRRKRRLVCNVSRRMCSRIGKKRTSGRRKRRLVCSASGRICSRAG